MKILVYGFGVYRNFTENITEKLLAALPKIDGVETTVFDVLFDREMFEREFERIKSDRILGLGQHPRARNIRNERHAKDRQSENGRTAIPISGTGDLRMSLDIPKHELVTTTYDAGDYVCNFSMYVAEMYARARGITAAFLHIPRQMDVEKGVEYLEQLLRELLRQ